ncbi:hypothetical protein ACK3C2_01995 [Mycoplasmoides gallisepticum]|uniref:hypothetical protein n=1 Tax=Mycoplasmoides gallisepticum TaxID=2096 RepID=UPI00335BC43D
MSLLISLSLASCTSIISRHLRNSSGTKLPKTRLLIPISTITNQSNYKQQEIL